MRIFGCVAYGLIPGQLRRKLESKSEKCIFIGYSSQSKGYRLYNPITKKFSVKRDVVFLEETKWAWKDKCAENPMNFDPFPCDLSNSISNSTPTPNDNNPSPFNIEESYPSPFPHGNSPPTHEEPQSQPNLLNNQSSLNQLNQNTSSHINSNSPGPSKRQTKTPAWFNDYVTGEGISDEDDVNPRMANGHAIRTSCHNSQPYMGSCDSATR
ncbi:putative RNA-directed DNA polymerase [Helianthus anomalus]